MAQFSFLRVSCRCRTERHGRSSFCASSLGTVLQALSVFTSPSAEFRRGRFHELVDIVEDLLEFVVVHQKGLHLERERHWHVRLPVFVHDGVAARVEQQRGEQANVEPLRAIQLPTHETILDGLEQKRFDQATKDEGGNEEKLRCEMIRRHLRLARQEKMLLDGPEVRRWVLVHRAVEQIVQNGFVVVRSQKAVLRQKIGQFVDDRSYALEEILGIENGGRTGDRTR